MLVAHVHSALEPFGEAVESGGAEAQDDAAAAVRGLAEGCGARLGRSGSGAVLPSLLVRLTVMLTRSDQVPPPPPPPPSRTKWTRLVHPSVLTGHVSSLSRSDQEGGESARALSALVRPAPPLLPRPCEPCRGLAPAHARHPKTISPSIEHAPPASGHFGPRTTTLGGAPTGWAGRRQSGVRAAEPHLAALLGMLAEHAGGPGVWGAGGAGGAEGALRGRARAAAGGEAAVLRVGARGAAVIAARVLEEAPRSGAVAAAAGVPLLAAAEALLGAGGSGPPGVEALGPPGEEAAFLLGQTLARVPGALAAALPRAARLAARLAALLRAPPPDGRPPRALDPPPPRAGDPAAACAPLLALCGSAEGRAAVPPPPLPRTNRTRRVPHPVLSGYVSSLSQVAAACGPAGRRRLLVHCARAELGAADVGAAAAGCWSRFDKTAPTPEVPRGAVLGVSAAALDAAPRGALLRGALRFKLTGAVDAEAGAGAGAGAGGGRAGRAGCRAAPPPPPPVLTRPVSSFPPY